MEEADLIPPGSEAIDLVLNVTPFYEVTLFAPRFQTMSSYYVVYADRADSSDGVVTFSKGFQILKTSPDGWSIVDSLPIALHGDAVDNFAVCEEAWTINPFTPQADPANLKKCTCTAPTQTIVNGSFQHGSWSGGPPVADEGNVTVFDCASGAFVADAGVWVNELPLVYGSGCDCSALTLSDGCECYFNDGHSPFITSGDNALTVTTPRGGTWSNHFNATILPQWVWPAGGETVDAGVDLSVEWTGCPDWSCQLTLSPLTDGGSNDGGLSELSWFFAGSSFLIPGAEVPADPLLLTLSTSWGYSWADASSIGVIVKAETYVSAK